MRCLTVNADNTIGALILVLEDVEETRDGIEKLLNADGYRVDAARNEQEAVTKGRRRRPDLILVSLGASGIDVLTVALRIRERAELGQSVPVVIFCVEALDEGAEVQIGSNVYATRPDNFDQLKAFLRRLLHHPAQAV